PTHQHRALREPILLQPFHRRLPFLRILDRGNVDREQLGGRLLSEADGGEAGLVQLGLDPLRVLGHREGAERESVTRRRRGSGARRRGGGLAVIRALGGRRRRRGPRAGRRGRDDLSLAGGRRSLSSRWWSLTDRRLAG